MSINLEKPNIIYILADDLGYAYIRGNDSWEERGKVRDYQAIAKDSTLEGQRPLPKSQIIAKIWLRNRYCR